MKICAEVRSGDGHEVLLQTDDLSKTLVIPPKADGRGSSVNGGELLVLALATCYMNDVYREAARRGITVRHVHVAARGEFPVEGAPGVNFTYHAMVEADAAEEAIRALMESVDQVAEIQNTLRSGSAVRMLGCKAVRR
ncbi:MAG: OsmC family protein [Bacteroidota bacterium]